MDVVPPLAPSDTNTPTRPPSPEVARFLARVGQEHHRFITALGEANRDLGPLGQLAKLATIHARLTQEFLDAQRAILKRRAETDAYVVEIAASAEAEADEVVRAAWLRAGIVVDELLPSETPESPEMVLSAMGRTETQCAPAVNDPLARLIDGVFETSEPDGVAARRQLRELLDAWWEAEKQEARAAADDASARAAMRVHTAKVEAAEITALAASIETDASPDRPGELSVILPDPMVQALDETDHEHLDDVLAHLLDQLDDAPIAPSRATDAAETASSGAGEGSADVEATGTGSFVLVLDAPRLPPPTNALTDRSAAPQEAFDRFWGGFRTGRTRRWVFPQLLLPAAAVLSVLALVLAVVG